MQDRWDHDEAASAGGPLGEIVYGSRLLGAEPALVLHGGGNTSIKSTIVDITGDEVDVLYVKGSGHDLASIGPDGFAPLRLERVRRLGELDSMTDTEMVNELRAALTDPSAPTPSVEAILHASLPHRAVLHSHADAVLALTDTDDDETHLRACFGDRVVLVPYVMPGFPLARDCARIFPAESTPQTEGMVLRKHGLFTFAETVEQAYHRMIELVSAAEDYVAARRHADTPTPNALVADPVGLAELRQELSRAAGLPVVCQVDRSDDVASFLSRDDVAVVTQQGPITPDHVIRTKRVPLLGRDVAGYVDAYERYVATNQERAPEPVTALDPAPRVVLDPELGMVAVGQRPGDAAVVADLYRHTMQVISAAEALGGYRSLPEGDLFDVEYWELEQAKLRRGGQPPALNGQVAVVTGAASGIGRACAEALMAQGAAIVALDIDPAVKRWNGDNGLGLEVDLRKSDAVVAAIEAGVDRFGGVDHVVIAAGVFGGSVPIAELADADWASVIDVNASSVHALLRSVEPYLERSPVDPRVVVIGSKNVAAPGRGAAAYSASKAAVTQLARVAALEWADLGVRVNVIHPDAVFDTGLWNDELLAKRAAEYDMSVEQYRRRNLLHTDVTSADVAALAVAMCGPAFRATTGAQVAVDGGNERVI